MTSSSLEDALDELLARAERPLSATEVVRRLPPALRRQVDQDPEAARLVREWAWLHQVVAAGPKPLPSPEFGDRVLRAVRRDNKTGGSSAGPAGGGRIGRWRQLATWSAAALGLVVAVGLWHRATSPPDVPPAVGPVAEAPSEPRPGDLPEPGFAELLERLPRDVAARRGEPIDAGAPPERGLTQRLLDGAEVAKAPPVGRPLRRTAGKLISAGQGVGTRVGPLTNSAVAAFDFLWMDLEAPPPEEKP